MKSFDELNERQREALLETNGPVLILAGAGSGKTKVVTSKIAYLIREKNVSPYNILAITFTNKAANEMKERAENLIGGNLNLWIGTFHSICVRILRKYATTLGYTSNFTIYDTLDSKTLVKDILKDFDLSPKYYSDSGIQAKISNLKNKMTTPEMYLKENEGDIYEYTIGKIYAEYEKRLKANNAFDFDNLILKTVELLSQNEEAMEYYNRRFTYVFVDEYQDTNSAQYNFIKLIAGPKPNITAVGDSDQSIYKWRGADINNILNFEKDFKGAKVILLEQNYRSTESILNAANVLIANNKMRMKKNLWTDKDKGKAPEYKEYDHSNVEEEEVVNKILQLNYKKNSFEDMAILYRANFQSRGFEEQLMRHGIPYRVVGGLKFYDRMEVKDILHYLRLIVNPEDDLSFMRVVNTPKRGIGDTTVGKLKDFAAEKGLSLFDAVDKLEPGVIASRTVNKIKDFKEMILAFQDYADRNSIKETMEEVVIRSGYMAELKTENTPTSRARIENIEELISAANTYEEKNPESKLSDYMAEMSLLSDVDKADSSKGVSLMTIHSAKGLEFPIVFVVGMEEGLFPSALSMEEEGGVEEERRLCYVAVTRSKRELYLSSARYRTKYGKTVPAIKSRFIDEMASELNVTEDNKRHETITFKPVETLKPHFKYEAPERPKENGLNLKVGDKVRHKKWGEGMVVMKKEKEGDYEITVSFQGQGLKKLKESVAPLERVK